MLLLGDIVYVDNCKEILDQSTQNRIYGILIQKPHIPGSYDNDCIENYYLVYVPNKYQTDKTPDMNNLRYLYYGTRKLIEDKFIIPIHTSQRKNIKFVARQNKKITNNSIVCERNGGAKYARIYKVLSNMIDTYDKSRYYALECLDPGRIKSVVNWIKIRKESVLINLSKDINSYKPIRRKKKHRLKRMLTENE